MRSLVLPLAALFLSPSFTGCGGGGGGTPVTPVPSNGITLQLTSSTLAVPEGSSASTTVNLARTGTTGSVSFSITGLPAGATVSYLNPESANSGQIIVMATTAATGTYGLTLNATDGT
ncbi:MAG: hypothetical protein WA294_13515, partial [Acidobacteriaceae bacterium]